MMKILTINTKKMRNKSYEFSAQVVFYSILIAIAIVLANLIVS
jgi:hypothetical protein